MGKKGGGGKKGKKESKKKSKKSRKSSKKESVVKQPSVTKVAPAEPPKPKCADDDVCCKIPEVCRPNKYPGILCEPEKMAIVGSENGSYESLCKLIRAGMRCADRVFAMTSWSNYVIYRVMCAENTVYFIYDGCTCNPNQFRYYDLREGTAGLLCFDSVHQLIKYMLESRSRHEYMKRLKKSVIDDICKEFCEYGSRQ